MRIAIGADHAGFRLKEDIKSYLRVRGNDVMDVGTHSEEPADYPDFAKAVGQAVANGGAERGIMVCGSGVGACVVANKIRGVRAGMCHDTYSAHQGVEHDDMNVLCLGSRIIGINLALELVEAFTKARFTEEDRHKRRLSKVLALEKEMAK